MEPRAPKAAFAPREGDKESPEEALRALLRRVRHIELRTKKAVNAHASGAYHSRFKGRGMAFDESRAYIPGDDPRHIDWNVTARTGELFVKQFIEERELTVLLAVDVSASAHFGTRTQTKRQVAAEAAALLAFSAMRNNDKVGLLLFSDRTERLVRPKKGRGHVLRILREILACEPQGQGTDIGEALRTVTHLSKKRAIVAFISDFIAPESSITREASDPSAPFGLMPGGPWERPLKVLQQRHDVFLVHTHDALEAQLPNVGLLRVVDPETKARIVVNTRDPKVRGAYEQAVRNEREAFGARAKRLGVQHIELDTDADAHPVLLRFLRRRSKAAA